MIKVSATSGHPARTHLGWPRSELAPLLAAAAAMEPVGLERAALAGCERIDILAGALCFGWLNLSQHLQI